MPLPEDQRDWFQNQSQVMYEISSKRNLTDEERASVRKEIDSVKAKPRTTEYQLAMQSLVEKWAVVQPVETKTESANKTTNDLQKSRTILKKTKDTPLSVPPIASESPEESEPIAPVAKEGVSVDRQSDDSLDVSKSMTPNAADTKPLERSESTKLPQTTIHPSPTTVDSFAKMNAGEQSQDGSTPVASSVNTPEVALPVSTAAAEKEAVQPVSAAASEQNPVPSITRTPTELLPQGIFVRHSNASSALSLPRGILPESSSLDAKETPQTQRHESGIDRIAASPTQLINLGRITSTAQASELDMSLSPQTTVNQPQATNTPQSPQPKNQQSRPITPAASNALGGGIKSLTNTLGNTSSMAASVLSGSQAGSQSQASTWEQELLDAIRKLTEAIEGMSQQKEKMPGPQKDGSFIPSLGKSLANQGISALGTAAGNIAGGSSSDMVKTITETLARAALAAL